MVAAESISSNTGPLYLALDQGGHASRALVYDARGNLITHAWREIHPILHGRYRAEYDAALLLASVREAIAEVTAGLGKARAALAGAGLATQRSSVVCWDRVTGEALSPVISWQDRRAQHWLKNFRASEETVRRITGLPLSAHYGASKLRWCLQHIPAVGSAQRVGRLAWGPLATFLLFHLLHERPLIVDTVNAARTLLWDLESGSWSAEMLDLFGLPRGPLPEVVSCRYAYGTLDCDGAAVPLTVVTGDQSAALYAGGPPCAGMLYITIGTGAFVQRMTGAHRRAVPGLLSGIAFQDGATPSYVIEGTVNGAGSALAWLAGRQHNATDFSALSQWLDTVDDPPLFMNGVSGLGTPFMIPRIPIRFIGSGGLAERAVAVIESIVFLLNINVEAMAATLGRAAGIHIGGGLARLDGLCRRLADLSGLAVHRHEEAETTARGLAWLLRNDADADAAWSGTQITPDPFRPQDNPALAARFHRWRQALDETLHGNTWRTAAAVPLSLEGVRWPALVAHRGYAARYPENSLSAVEAALRAGVQYVEVDVQLTADGIPVLFHDVGLRRTTGSKGRITEITAETLTRLRMGETARLGARFHDTPIPTLVELMDRLGAWPKAQVFIEIKQESLDAFGIDAVVGKIMQAIAPRLSQCIVISFNPEAIQRARALGASRVGWVLAAYDDAHHAQACKLAPDFLFCNYRKLRAPTALLWSGTWRWVFYEVTDPAVARSLLQRGAALIETMALDAYADPPWSLTPDGA